MFRKTVLLTIVFLANFANSKSHYVFPEPVIVPFKPQGLQVTLAHSPGDRIFAFHGNINRPTEPNEVGDLAQEISKRTKGQWVINFPDVKLKNGDKIYYWLFIHNGALGYRYTDRVYEVTNFESDEVIPTEKPCDSTPSESATICERALVSLTQSLLNSQVEAASLRESVEIFRNIVQEDPKLSQTLVIEGLVAPDSELKSLLRAIISEKLLLPSVTIENVTRIGDGKVQFKVRNIDEKLEIIKAAKEKLKYSRYSISY